jgi:putative hemolysin
MPAVEILIVIILILVNGILAMSELAVVSARRARLQAMAERQVPGARRALRLAENPGRFLSTVQIGITLVGILAGAFSGASLGARLSNWLTSLGMDRDWADPVGLGLVVAVITYLSLIIGELVPKQIALRNAERIACLVAPAMSIVARVSSPAVSLLDASGRAVLRLFGRDSAQETQVTEEEIRMLVAEAESAGVLESEERQMITGVMQLGSRPVRGVMTPRPEVDLVDLSQDPADIRKKIMESVHSRLPAHNGNPDEIVGVIQAKDMLDAYLKGRKPDPRRYLKKAPVIPDTMDALETVMRLKESEVHMGLVHDELGHFEGIVTSADILESIVGTFHTEEGAPEPEATQRDDGSWLVAGSMPADELAALLNITLPAKRLYQTVAGLVLEKLGRLPKVGESFTFSGWRFEVVDLDGRRVDKIMISRPTINTHRKLT